MEVTAEVGLKPGCGMQRLECDVTHAGKEAKGIVIYIEIAYDADGKAVSNKHFWANPKVAASLYTTECVVRSSLRRAGTCSVERHGIGCSVRHVQYNGCCQVS